MSDRVVVDASLAAKWVLTEEHADEAVHLLADWHRRQIRRLAPGWFLAEVANIVYKRVRGKTVTVPIAKSAVRQISRAVVLRPIGPRLAERAIELADQYALPAAYDAHYLALA